MIAADRTLLEQARELQALAQTGLAYCKNDFHFYTKLFHLPLYFLAA